MSVQSRQAFRMIKFIAELKKNSYPNAESFAKLLRQADTDENIDLSVSTRTIARDIKTLINDYHAPLVYDAQNRGYYLKYRDWELNCPIIDDDILPMALLGTRIASDILPSPLKEDIDQAVSNALSGNSSDFFDDTMIESLMCATGIKSAIEPEVFKTVFDAWRLHQMVAFEYRNPKGETTKRKFEPHIIAFHKGNWYAKGYDYGTKQVKSYAIQRMEQPEFGGDIFITDKKLLDETRRNGLFEYSKVDGVRLHCDASIAFYLYEHQKTKKFKIERQDDDSLIITLRPAFEHEVIRWVLGESGHIEVLEPKSLRQKVAKAAQKILEINS